MEPSTCSEGGGADAAAEFGAALIPVTDLLSVVTDPEGGAVTLVSVALHSLQKGLVFRSGDQILYVPPAGFQGEDEFTYTARDEAGLTAVGSVKITVSVIDRPPVTDPPPPVTDPANRPPVTGLIFRSSAILGQTLTIPVPNLLAVVSDPDGDPLTLSSLPDTTRHGATLTRAGETVVVNWEAGDAEESFASAGSDDFRYVVEDGRGGSVTANATIQLADGLGAFRIAGSEVIFNLMAGSGTWTIERAEEIQGPWTPVGTVEITFRVGRPKDTVEFRDANPPSGRAFYRATAARGRRR
ncbi:MAG: cadherin-like domain-containing protein [Verrucomicrobiia bacterium]